MMGSGKSTVGKLLAKTLGYCFFDTDALIEGASRATVAQIFKEEGEEAFREAETQVLQVRRRIPIRHAPKLSIGGVSVSNVRPSFLYEAYS
jgi:shikimate kinase